MSVELNYQRDVIDAFKDLGGWGFKLTNQFTSGIMDLLLVHQGTTYLVEVKMFQMPIREVTRIRFDHPLTGLQEQTILRAQKAGANAGILCCCRERWGDRMMAWHNTDPANHPSMLEFMNQCQTRKRGIPLSIQILETLAPLLSRTP